MGKGTELATAVVSLLVFVLVFIVGIPTVARILGEAASRGEDTNDNEGDSGRDEERHPKE